MTHLRQQDHPFPLVEISITKIFSFYSIIPMPETYELYVAHYGHIRMSGAKHWSLLLSLSNDRAIAYQITGSTDTYEYKQPQEVEVLKSQGYIGKVKVGMIGHPHFSSFVQVLQRVPVIRGRLNWNCQDWVVDALNALNGSGFHVTSLSKEELASHLAQSSRG